MVSVAEPESTPISSVLKLQLCLLQLDMEVGGKQLSTLISTALSTTVNLLAVRTEGDRSRETGRQMQAAL